MSPDPAPHRRLCLRAALALGVAGPLAVPGVRADTTGGDTTGGDTPPALAFLGFELIDEQPDPARWPELRARAGRIGTQLAEGLQARGLYRVVDLAPAQAVLDSERARHEYLHRCNGCLEPVAAALAVGLVGVGWVQRVSHLILNLNLAIWRLPEDRMVLTKSVDIRGDNDESWRRGIAYLLRDMAERRARQPGYGR